jgi:hypothetical protein
MQLPARHAIGDRVRFGVYETGSNEFFPAEVVRISFDPGKVLYDLALVVNGDVYYDYPVRGVDSCFVQPTVEAAKEAAA